MTLESIINTIIEVALLAVPWLLVLVAFFWNLASLLFNVEDAEKLKQARPRIIWSIIAMFVLFTYPGIVVLLQNTFFVSNAGQSSQGCAVVNGVEVCQDSGLPAGSSLGGNSNFAP